MAYNTDFQCTYQLLGEDGGDESDDLYRSQFLQAVGLKEWNDDEVGRRITEIQERHGDSEWLTGLARQLEPTNAMFSLIPEPMREDVLFTLLFQYDLFWATHAFLVDPSAGSRAVLQNLVASKVGVSSA